MTNKFTFAWVIIFFCLTQLVACSFVNHNIDVSDDGPPRFKVDVSKIPNATPKKEAMSPYGNQSYKINGHHYNVLKSAKNYDKYGMASWYGSKFHGKLTSTREQYNLYGMTAASTTLPLPTYVRVTNLENNRSVIVKVNDRGPFSNARLIDLSYAAAEKLGFTEKGVTKVHVVALDPSNWDKKLVHHTQIATNSVKTPLPKVISSGEVTKKAIASAKSKKTIRPYLQIGAYKNLASAQKLSKRITNLTAVHTRINKTARNSNTIYRIQIGPLSNNAESTRIRNLLERHGLGTATIIRG